MLTARERRCCALLGIDQRQARRVGRGVGGLCQRSRAGSGEGNVRGVIESLHQSREAIDRAGIS